MNDESPFIFRLFRNRLFLVLIAWSLWLSSPLAAEEQGWFQYRAGEQRSSHVPEDLPEQWSRSWVFESPLPPSPAWPDPAPRSFWQQLTNITARITEDQAFHPVIAHDTIFWGSSSENLVRAVDARTGSLKWEFHCEAPVRYAPVCDGGGRVWFSSDDGRLRCVDALSGELIWQKRIGPNGEMIPGNGRMISRWPLRTGVMLANNRLYTTAGLFPSQGIWMVGLDPHDGRELFRRKMDSTPHGYMLAGGERVFIPTGRSTPLSLAANGSGEFHDIGGLPGTFAVIDDSRNTIMTGPGNSGEINWAETAPAGGRLARFKGQHLSLTPTFTILAHEDVITCIDRPRYQHLLTTAAALGRQIESLKKLPESAEKRADLNRAGLELDATRAGIADCRLWETGLSTVFCLASSRNLVFAGTSTGLHILDIQTGEVIQEFNPDAQGFVMSVAVTRSHLVAVTGEGTIHGFHPAIGEEAAPVQKVRPHVSVSRRFDAGKSGNGFGLALVGAGDAQEMDALIGSIRDDSMQWIIAAQSRPVLTAVRNEFTRQGVIDGVAFQQLPEQSRDFPWPEGSINRLVILPGFKIQDPDYRARIVSSVHPWRFRTSGIDLDEAELRKPEGEWTHQFANSSSTSYSGDDAFSLPVKLQWFGGPGPATMVDRHLRGPAPLCAEGILVIPGENLFMAVDAFNGQLLWQRAFPGSQRYTMPYDAGYYFLDGGVFALARGAACELVDPLTGRTLSTLEAPVPASGQTNFSWGYLSSTSGGVLGSLQKESASRMDPSRQLINDDYNNRQPIVFSESLFRMNLPGDAGRPVPTEWIHPSRGSIPNPSICADSRRIYFLESASVTPSGRGLLQDFLENQSVVTALDVVSGEPQWSVPVPSAIGEITSSVFTCVDDNRLIITGALERNRDTLYKVACLDAASGEVLWQSEHFKGRPGAFTHGEQVHHPVVMNSRIIAEPVIYDMQDGNKVYDASRNPWSLNRPGHSCGTLTAAGNTLFFRAGNPTAMDLSRNLQESGAGIIKLAPTRPGCWINMIPACGLLLVPEASSGCVCHFSLQTSMAFRPGEPYPEWTETPGEH